jgi:uncharacterized membrane protein
VPDKDEESRLDRELIELLNELRIALPGVQVLFAFLLVLPFQQRFETLGERDRDVYFVAFLATALSSVLLIAPSVFHRLRWRDRDKEYLLVVANRMAIAGSFLLAVAMVCTVFLITDVLFGGWEAIVTTVVAAVAFGWFWYGLPLRRELGDRRR